jgi:hypothetical protein
MTPSKAGGGHHVGAREYILALPPIQWNVDLHRGQMFAWQIAREALSTRFYAAAGSVLVEGWLVSACIMLTSKQARIPSWLS